MYPQKSEAGIVKISARAVIIPISTREPPIVGEITYKGMNTDNNPNAISWKKKPNRHIEQALFSKMN
jgi:hypothetical protein